MKNLIDYTTERGISVRRLAEITDVCYPQLYNLSRGTKHNITMMTAEKIARGTKREFGKALLPWEYLEMPVIKSSLDNKAML